ncbi:MAG: A/G-specific adenine glycosylase [Bacteroidota bacterium]
MDFSNYLIYWYLKNKRDLPWRKTKNPYKIWLSEVILQQTRIAQGTPYYLKFLEEFPTIFDLAKADEDTVLKLWQGLGYYTRARNLHQSAKFVVKHYKGEFPSNYNDIIKLKGIGEYTAAAISSICFNEPHATVDGNVYRVLSRYFNINTPINSTKGIKQFKQLSQSLISIEYPGNHNQAIMELGAMICTPKNVKCDSCPLNQSCLALKHKNIASLPVKDKKIKIKKRFFNFLVFDLSGNFTILEQRTEKDIWQNLYQFPLYESAHEIDFNEIIKTNIFKKITKKSNYNIQVFNKKPFIHKLTHQHIHTKFWLIKTQSHYKNVVKWENVSTFAVPTLIHNFINKFIK